MNVTDDGPVRRVTLDRPEARNALTAGDVRDLQAAFDPGRLGPDTRAVVVGAATDPAHPVFSAGMHVDEFLALGSVAEAEAFIGRLRDLLRAVRTAPVPVLVAVDGPCIGAAFELALAADLRVATTRAAFGLPEVRLGIPSVVDAALLQQHVGLALAKEIVLTGDLYPVDRLGALCNAVVEPSGLAGAVEELLGKVTGHTRTVLAAQKRLFETWQNTGLAAGADRSVQEFAGVFAEAETREVLADYRARLGRRRKD
ncbi:enoyl-CoA hydratase/isomerase family protein [Pseudonocardia kujensis]|uniref:enoyl-CoA hydratase/isomerase family protein n=1 Tax=Pseudonocardia kujensis TaxID=1128675 RepID=UPI001E423723|nr:enoyl-CoA hydratase/isomerase family protein [Pseudonocardia kujensis]MCE0762606.1 enoyl-CoA hydratase/isomerase family protein [Pseudonocardia kujensis]